MNACIDLTKSIYEYHKLNEHRQHGVPTNLMLNQCWILSGIATVPVRNGFLCPSYCEDICSYIHCE